MRKLLLPAACSIALAIGVLGAPVQAQDGEEDGSAASAGPEYDDGDVIIVEGGRPDDVSRSDVTRQARDIAQQAGNVYDVPLARFEDRLCPAVAGMEAQYATQIIDRIRDNAVDFGVRLHDDNCSPNFFVIFAPDSEAMMRTFLDDAPELFVNMDPGEKGEMLESGPVHVFTRVDERTRDGMPIATSTSSAPPVLSTWSAHSRIYTALRNDITQVFVIFSMDAVRGKSLVQLADYAVMRGLAQTKPSEDGSMDSILTLFSGDAAPPETLTRFDRAYLRAVYDWIPNLPAISKLTGVNRQLRLLDREIDERSEERYGQDDEQRQQ